MKEIVTRLLEPPMLLGTMVLCAWLGMKLAKIPTDAPLDNVVMIIVGYIWGSSSGSKDKDRALAAAAEAKP